MSDREILDKYVDLKRSSLSDLEKKQVMDILKLVGIVWNRTSG